MLLPNTITSTISNDLDWTPIKKSDCTLKPHFLLKNKLNSQLHQDILSNMGNPCDVFLNFNHYTIKTRIIIKIPSVKTNCLFARTNLVCTSNRINLNTLPKILLKLPWETKYGWISIFSTSDTKRGLVSIVFITSKHTVKR